MDLANEVIPDRYIREGKGEGYTDVSRFLNDCRDHPEFHEVVSLELRMFHRGEGAIEGGLGRKRSCPRALARRDLIRRGSLLRAFVLLDGRHIRRQNGPTPG